jgi:protein-S-isoprenylcysteine O-methyltransferase Ste14
MKLLRDWGFAQQGWRGQHGEYWVVAQAILVIGFAVLPVYRPVDLPMQSYPIDLIWAIAALLAMTASVLLIKGIVDLGRSLTPLPYPREDGQLVQSGVYSVVRHPLYSGLVMAALSWSMFQISLSHLLGGLVLCFFFNAKARQEEQWLEEKYPDYMSYRQRVKKLIPWIY